MKLKVAKKRIPNCCLHHCFFFFDQGFILDKVDIGFVSSPSVHRHHYCYVKPKQSTARGLKPAICALCLSQPKCLLLMKVEVVNVEEQVAPVITDNCQLCWGILREHFGIPPPSHCDRCPGAVGLHLHRLIMVHPSFSETLSRLSFLVQNEIGNVPPKDEILSENGWDLKNPQRWCWWNNAQAEPP